MPRLDQVADIGKYAPVIGTGVKACLPVNCLSIDNYLVRQLNSADIYTIQDLKRHYMTDLRRLLGDEMLSWFANAFVSLNHTLILWMKGQVMLTWNHL